MANDDRIIILDDEGAEIEVPTRFEVCSYCRGKGTCVNPAIDGNGLSREDFDEDPDFAEDYFSGQYDITCPTCGGKRVEVVADWDAMSPELRARYEQWCQDEADYRATCEAERRMGA